jgi:serine/threonine-protein kinase
MRVTEDPEPLLKKRADLAPGFAAVIMRALARDPVDRFPSAAAMRDAIIPFVGDNRVDDKEDITATCGIDLSLPVGVTPQPAAKPRRAGRGTRRFWPWVAGGLTAALFVAVSLTLDEWPLRGGGHEAQNAIPTVSANVDTSAHSSTAGAGPTSLPVTTKPAPVPPTATSKPTTTTTPRLRQAATVPVPPPRRPVIAPRLKANSNVQLPGILPPVCANQVVNLSVVVGEDGSVVNARMISASPAECGEIAAAAVRTLEYEPALAADQQPIESTIAIAVPFKEVSE